MTESLRERAWTSEPRRNESAERDKLFPGFLARLDADLSRAFFDRDVLISADVFQRRGLATGPFDFNRVNLRAGT